MRFIAHFSSFRKLRPRKRIKAFAALSEPRFRISDFREAEKAKGTKDLQMLCSVDGTESRITTSQ